MKSHDIKSHTTYTIKKKKKIFFSEGQLEQGLFTNTSLVGFA